MFFIGLLMAATSAIALAAAYFSVYGLAYTFSGVFWSVVAMGASLEAGKLVAASYLYRYWNKTHRALKYYLMAGVACLMVLTSTGIFGYLSTGYQQDVLPLQQKNEQIKLLETEKARNIDRKTQIDSLLAGGAQVTNVNRANGTIDPNAARVLRETTKARESQYKQYKEEQVQVTKRVSDLDAQLLELKQDVLKTEAHIGPITYIAKAFGLPSDDATKYLIFIIIFAFDPMAVALTLATNNALEIRRKELEEKAKASAVVPPELVTPTSVPEGHIDPNLVNLPVTKDQVHEFDPVRIAEENSTGHHSYPDAGEDILNDPFFPMAPERHSSEEITQLHQDFGFKQDEPALIQEDFISRPPEEQTGLGSKVEVLPGSDGFPVIDETMADNVPVEQDQPVLVDVPEVEPEPETEEPPVATPLVEQEDKLVQQPANSGRRTRPFPHRTDTPDMAAAKLRELFNHYKFLKAKQDNGDVLSETEAWELNSIEAIMRSQGFTWYL